MLGRYDHLVSFGVMECDYFSGFDFSIVDYSSRRGISRHLWRIALDGLSRSLDPVINALYRVRSNRLLSRHLLCVGRKSPRGESPEKNLDRPSQEGYIDSTPVG